MTKAKKRLLTLLLAMLMAVGMAVPTFAAPREIRTEIQPYSNSLYRLNTKTVPHDYANVNLWQNTGHESQRWNFSYYGGGLYSVGVTVAPKYCLNIIRSTGNCTVLDYAENLTSDYLVKLVDESALYGTDAYGLVLPQHVKVLQRDADPTENGINVSWGAPGELGKQQHQIWIMF